MSMHKLIVWLSLSSFILLFSLIMRLEPVYAQANRSNGGDVTCPVSGSSIQVLPARSSRYSFVLNNTSGIDIRIGFLESGTVALTASNSLLLKGGQPYSDSAPGGFSLRVVCMSTTAVTATISFMETYR